MADLGMKFDDVLKNLTGQAGSLEALLGVFFSFLHRNTDFYVTFDPAKTTRPGMGFPPGQAEQLLLRAFNSLPYKQYGGQQQQQQPRTGNGRGTRRGAATRGGKPKAAPVSHTPEVVDRSSSSKTGEAVAGEPTTATPPSQQQQRQQQQASSGSGRKGSQSSPDATCGEGAGPSSLTATASCPQAVTSAATTASESNSVRVRYTDTGKQVPIGNGGVTPKYYWTQTVSEATVYIDVPPGTRSKDVSCLIQPRRLKLRVRGAGAMATSSAAAAAAAAAATVTAATPAAAAAAAKGLAGAARENGDVIIDGELPSAVSREGSMWSLSDGKTVVISFEKATRTWWKSVVEGDPEIDTSKVDSTSNISEYDDETQSTIRKIMFDQRQKALGLPTSDQISSNSLLEKAKGLPGSPFLPGGALFNGGGSGGDRGAATAAAAAAAVPAQNRSESS
ncbi:unnamed protein product [Laminaria digitata]